MRTRTPQSLCLIPLLSAVTWALGQGKENQDANKAAAPPPGQAAAMEQWVALMKPGDAHKRLEQFGGEWQTKMKLWMAGPDAPPIESGGSTTTRWALGKRFLIDEHRGQMYFPDASGQLAPLPFEGLGRTGYDNHRNLYVGTWADSMSTQLLTFSGSVDATGRVFTYYGAMDEPMLKVIGRTVKYEVKIVSDDQHVFTIYDLHAGPDYKVVQITYTRKKL